MSNIAIAMSDIQREALTEILSALAEQIGENRAHVHLVIIGGSALLADGLNDRPTQDVDVVAFWQRGRFVSADPFPVELTAAAKRVASDFGLKTNWLNPGPTSLLEIAGLPEGFADRMTAVSYGPCLTVSHASRYDQIHLKLYAFADREEPRDESDLRGLDPTADELHAAAAWVRRHNAPGPFDERLTDVLRVFGVDDVGRDD